MKSAKEWFLKYICVPSASDETTGTIPSTEDQKKLFPCFERAYDGVVKFLEGDRDGAVAAANRAPETAK